MKERNMLKKLEIHDDKLEILEDNVFDLDAELQCNLHRLVSESVEIGKLRLIEEDPKSMQDIISNLYGSDVTQTVRELFDSR
jgi:hypothetical protein